MTTPDQIIVLHYTRYSEKAVILHTLSRSFGRKSFIVKDASRLMAFFQPLNILDCEIVSNPRSSLSSARAFVEPSPLVGIRTSMGKNAISMFMAELVYRAVAEDAQERGLFEWMRKEIMLLEVLSSDYSNFHIHFLMDFAAAMGFAAAMNDLLPFMEDSAPKASELIEADFAQAMLVKMSGAQRTAMCTRLLKYLEFHLDTPLHIRSLGVLGELFAG